VNQEEGAEQEGRRQHVAVEHGGVWEDQRPQRQGQRGRQGRPRANGEAAAQGEEEQRPQQRAGQRVGEEVAQVERAPEAGVDQDALAGIGGAGDGDRRGWAPACGAQQGVMDGVGGTASSEAPGALSEKWCPRAKDLSPVSCW
jgi:hypothetical protein